MIQSLMGETRGEQVVAPLIRQRPWDDIPDKNPWMIEPQRWNKAEKAASQILSKFQPTVLAEKKRAEIIKYLQRLLKAHLGCELFAYGSVPLRTYLPDGDIDLTAVGTSKSDLIEEIALLLESEEKNSSSEFVVKDVQRIAAEVKLVKCLVQNIVVDISSNQVGGVSALCFLEQVDQVIGKDHLFKQSIILIKAWCYYESRTLGAHAGLISTYGLETMVLYIFHVFHRAVDGPLSALYKFLDYYSAFDWDNYCISLIGPVKISALPKIMADKPPNSHDLLLKRDFLRRCSETFSVPTKVGQGFSRRHLNIVDPLRDDNNLGRSVSRGNLVRIRSAFTFGARDLKRILLTSDNIGDGIRNFFSNTLRMHGGGQRPDVLGPVSRASPSVCSSEVSKTVSGAETFNPTKSGQQRSSSDENASAESGFSANRSSLEGKDVSTLGLQGLKVSEDSHKISKLCGEAKAAAPFGTPHHEPHLYSQNSVFGKMENGNSLGEKQQGVPSAIQQGPKSDRYESDKEVSPSEPLDLTGNMSANIATLQRVRSCHAYVLAQAEMLGPALPLPQPFLVSMSPLERAHHFAHMKNGFHHGGMNGVVHGPSFHPLNQMLMPRPPFCLNPDPTIAGTCFLDMNQPPHGYQASLANGKNNRVLKSPLKAEFQQSQSLVDQFSGNQTVTDSDMSDFPSGTLNPSTGVFVPLPNEMRQPRTPFREPLLHSRQQNFNHSLLAKGTQRPRGPRPVSGMKRTVNADKNKHRRESSTVGDDLCLQG